MDEHGLLYEVAPAFDAVADGEHVARAELLEFPARVHEGWAVRQKVEVGEHVVVLRGCLKHDAARGFVFVDGRVEVFHKLSVVVVLVVVVFRANVEEEEFAGVAVSYVKEFLAVSDAGEQLFFGNAFVVEEFG